MNTLLKELPVYVVDGIGKVVTKMNQRIQRAKVAGDKWAFDEVFYMHEHRQLAAHILRLKENDPVAKFRKFPLIFLKQDFTEDFVDGMIHLNLNIAILAESQRDRINSERYEEVFKPVIGPLFKLFTDTVGRAGVFTWAGDSLPFTKLDRPYYGVEGTEGNANEYFSEPLDAIELVNLRINCLDSTCETV